MILSKASCFPNNGNMRQLSKN